MVGRAFAKRSASGSLPGEIDNFIKSLFNQSFAFLMLIIISILAFLYFDFTTIVAGFNQQLIVN